MYQIEKYGNIIHNHNKIEFINKTLTEFWRINNEIAKGRSMNGEEMEFWNDNLHLVKGYYSEKAEYVNSLKRI